MCHWIPMGNFPMNFWGWIFSSSSQEPWCLWKQPPCLHKGLDICWMLTKTQPPYCKSEDFGRCVFFLKCRDVFYNDGSWMMFPREKKYPKRAQHTKKGTAPPEKKHQEFRTINCCLRVFQIMFQGVYMLENSFKAPRLGSETFDVWTTWCSVFFCLDSSKFQWITVGFFVEM